MNTLEALKTRRSVRGFSQTQVPRATLEQIFGSAQHAPSWCNIQPWHVIVTSGATTQRLVEALCATAKDAQEQPEFAFPTSYPEPYRTRRIECATALFAAMGITREDRIRRKQTWMRNFAAFDAPHVAIVSMDPTFGVYGSLDVGCWLQSVLLAATALGVATCPQASLASCPQAVRSVLPIPDSRNILVGISMGYEDHAVPANQCRTTRNPIRENVVFID